MFFPDFGSFPRFISPVKISNMVDNLIYENVLFSPKLGLKNLLLDPSASLLIFFGANTIAFKVKQFVT